jgi:ubiquinone/menaquinone biosynthesis C-methylase UbiE
MPERPIPALGYSWLTSLYDPVVRWTTRERTFKGKLLAQAAVSPGDRVLDVGCGTGTLTIELKQRCPESTIVGIDADADVLAIAARKLRAAGVEVALDIGRSDDLPYEDATFDRAVSSLMLHHLTRAEKKMTLRELFRVLRPGGQLHVADWGRAQDIVMRGAFLVVQLLDGFETTTDNVHGALPELISAAGFQAVCETERMRTPLGTLSLYRGDRP